MPISYPLSARLCLIERRTIPLPLEQTFALLADHNQLSAVLGLRCKRTRDGEGDVNGLGSVRKLGLWPMDFDETITGFQPNTRIDYRITRGTPLRNHRGSVSFSGNNRKTLVTWNIEYEMSIPVLGAVIRQALRFGIARGLGRLR